MLTLAFDTATVSGRFALADDGGVLVGRRHNVAGSYADALLPVIDEMLDEASRELTEITRTRASPKKNRHFSSRLVSPRARWKGRYAISARKTRVPESA